MSDIKVSVRKSTRARQLRISVKADGSVVAVQPMQVPLWRVHAFVAAQREWIRQKVAYFKQRPVTNSLRQARVQKITLSERKRVLTFVEQKLEYFNRHYGFFYRSVAVRNQKSRWGSCSARGSLNFNYKIASLPEHVADYIVVHELCHLKELNHSKNFWNLVAKTIPDYKIIRRELKSLSHR